MLQRVFCQRIYSVIFFITGGGFSTDGVHPSKRYAVIANKFIEAINMQYGSNLKGVDIGIIEYYFQGLVKYNLKNHP
jgi:hypothetical protein